MNLYPIVRPLFFLQDAEKAHERSLHTLKCAANFAPALVSQPAIDDHVALWGLRFPNRVGLAAGLDKNGDYIDGLARLGFGFLEIGTVTPRPQTGNPKPRLFRLAEHRAIINRMGFNNDGVDKLVENVKNARFDGVLGINIGKNKDTPTESADQDYLICLEKVFPYASYVTINLSSPNTPGLRDLQYGNALKALLETLKEKQQTLAQSIGKSVPLLVKVAPDLAREDVEQVTSAILAAEIEGIIATNTTLSRHSVEGHIHGSEAGGLSGAPLRDLSTKVLGWFVHAVDGRIPIIGVGGIDRARDAVEKIQTGASLVQIYSGLIYGGPALVPECARAIKTAAVEDELNPASMV